MAKLAEGTPVKYTWEDGSEHTGTVKKAGYKWIEIKNEKGKTDYIAPDKVQAVGQVVEAEVTPA
jgi:hypothetical protein